MLDDDVAFLGQIKDREFLQSVYARSDLFLFPSIYDNAPIVIKEAAAAGCPSLVIENSNSAEGIQNNFNGYTVQNDPEIFSNRIHVILSDMEELKHVGVNAQKTLCQNWESIVENVADRYKEIIETYGRNRVV